MSRWGAEISVLTEELAESDRFWRTYGVDKEHGGFMCSLGHDGELLAPNKFICETGR
jgi:mannose/cellobiose epimerase-like protein (N-acyl-D-glucosamine 2-epimerase family)